MGLRRPIKVWGAIMADGSQITENDEGVVSVTCHPDKSVTTLDAEGKETRHEGEWASYNPRYN